MDLDFAAIRKYYERTDIQQELLIISKDREVQAWFGESCGKRPEAVYMLGDLKDLIRQGMTSFHISEERWIDPLQLEPGMQKRNLENLRKGWDMILDLDCKNLGYSQAAAELLIDAIKFHNVTNVSVKFSGNHGFHIAVPFEAFPDEVNGIHIKDYFPEGIRIISEYLKDMTAAFLAEKMLKKESVDEIAKNSGKKIGEIFTNGKFDPYQVVSVDSVLISSRHLFRAPYSINEKSGLVSIPLHDIKKFDISKAKMENVKIEMRFMDSEKAIKGEARKLLMQAFDWAMKKNKPEIKKFDREYSIPKDAVKADFFPPCILKLMAGINVDGRKRAVFILINFLRHMGWTFEQTGAFLNEWNKKNYEQLREGYISAQVSWAKRQNQKILPANCDNPSYYKGMAVCCPDDFCRMIKNPVQYANKKLNLARRLEEEEARKKPKAKAKKKIDS
jgi:DNA primase large subunit